MIIVQLFQPSSLQYSDTVLPKQLFFHFVKKKLLRTVFHHVKRFFTCSRYHEYIFCLFSSPSSLSGSSSFFLLSFFLFELLSFCSSSSFSSFGGSMIPNRILNMSPKSCVSSNWSKKGEHFVNISISDI